MLLSRINQLNDARSGGTPRAKDTGSSAGGGSGVPGSGGGGGGGGGGSSGGGTGLISTWKKLKGKKKKQRNLTAPEISSQELKAAMDDTGSTTTLTPVAENEKKDGGKTKTRFGKKQGKEKTEPQKQKSSEIVLKNDLADSPGLPEENFLSQVSDLDHPSLSEPSGGTPHENDSAPIVEVSITSPASISGSKSSDVIVLEPLDLSQVSGKQSGASLSQSETFTGNDEHLSTQSSAEVPISGGLIEEGQQNSHSEGWRRKEGTSEDVHYEGSYFQGSAKLYKEYGNKQHKLNLERVRVFLESSGEREPMDLSVLQDWDGWMVANREIMYKVHFSCTWCSLLFFSLPSRLPSTTKESQLI